MQWMVNQNIISNSSQLSRKPRRDGLKFIYPRETHLRLGRAGGVIAYVFAKKDPNETNQVPGLWVEQDQFRIVKARLASGAEISASSFEASDKLFFPGIREVKYPGGEVRIKLLKLSKMASGAESKSIFNHSELNEKVTVLPEDPQIRQFYERFR
jgi:hypothetical protein